MATYYVRTDGSDANTGTADTAGGAWLTWGHAAANATTDDDIVYVKKGTYNLSSTTVNADGGPVKLATNIRLTWMGYEDTPGDDCPTDNFPILHANGNNAAIMFQMVAAYNRGQAITCLEINCDDQNATMAFYAASSNVGRYCLAYRCVARNAVTTGTSHGFSQIFCTRCHAEDFANNGFYLGHHNFCSATGCNNGFYLDSQSHEASHCIAYGNTDGFFASYMNLTNCTAHNNSSDGFDMASNTVAANCLATNNLAYGFQAGLKDSKLIRCAGYSNSSGNVLASSYLINVDFVDLTGDPYTNKTGFDFSLGGTAGNELLGQGYDVMFQTAGYASIGAVHDEPAAGIPLINTRRNAMIGR